MSEAKRLNALKARMTKAQRNQMAELLSTELKNRERAKLLGKSRGRATPPLGKTKTSAHSAASYKRAAADAAPRELIQAERGAFVATGSSRNMLLLGALLFFAFGKVLFSSGVVNASVERNDSTLFEQASAKVQLQRTETNWNETQKELLTKLDERRVTLAKREKELENREEELSRLEGQLALRLTELKMLTERVANIRKDRDHRHEARMEQLAQVYGSMAPKEAAPLIAKLDEHISLSLLERLPGKRMGQILSLMDSERAIKLTKLLSERRSGQ